MRFYKKEIPNIDEIVICHVERIQDYCIYVKLIEYNNIEGMVQLADASTRRKRRSKCLLKVNKKYPLLVIRVDESNNFIDLSNKFLSKEDKDSTNKRYNNYCYVIKIFKKFLSTKFSSKYDEDIFIEYANKTIWKLQPKKCYEYIVQNYIDNNNFNEFDIDQIDKDILKNVLLELFGKIIFKSTFNFMARNTNFSGIKKLKEIFENIHKNHGITIRVEVVPKYYLMIESDKTQSNIDKINKLEPELEKMMLQNNCLYKKIDIVTTNNLN